MNRLPGPLGRADVSCIDHGTLGLFLSQAPVPAGVTKPPRARDELTPIAHWMVQEMRRNAAGPDAQRILSLNTYSVAACIGETREWPWWQQLLSAGHWNQSCVDRGMAAKPAAHLAWGALVRQNGVWDHKPIIARRFTPAVESGEQHYHRYHDHVYFYDVWSNIHYGYVGRACGFSEAELLDGAGVEQIASDLIRGDMPKESVGVSGMRRFDHPSDRVAVTIGTELFKASPSALDAAHLVSRIVARRAALGARSYLR